MKNRLCLFMSAVILLLACSSLCVSADTEEIKAGYFYFGSYQENIQYDEYEGSIIDFYSAIAQYEDFNYRFMKGTYQECLTMLENGSIDILGGVIKDDELEAKFEFSDISIGDYQPKLYALMSNENLKNGDFASLNNMRIALLKGSRREMMIDTYCLENGFGVQKVYFNRFDEMIKALENGNVDAVLSSNMTDKGSYKIVGVLEECPIYFATLKNSPVMDKVNRAMSQIMYVNPDFKYNNSKTHQQNRSFVPVFNEEELAYIESKKQVRVVFDPNWRPIEYYDAIDKKYMGISAEILDLVSEYSGLEFLYQNTATFSNSLSMVTTGDADILSGLANDYAWAEKNNVLISMPYLSSTVVAVGRKEDMGNKFRKIALPKNYLISTKIEQEKLGSQIVMYDTVEECITAVNNKKADATYVNNYVAEYYLSKMKYNMLSVVETTEHTENICIAVSKKADPVLLSIINKSLACIPDITLEQAVIRNSISDEPLGITSYLYAHPVQSVAFIIILALLIIAYFMLKANKARESKQIVEKAFDEARISNERFQVIMKYIPCDILEYDLNTNNMSWFDKKTGNKLNVMTDNKVTMNRESYGVVYPAMKNVLKSLYERMNGGEKVIVEILEGKDRTGEMKWGRFTATAVKNSWDMPVQAMCVIEDITDSIGTSMELADKFTAALKSTYDEVYELDLKKDSIAPLYTKNRIFKRDEAFTPANVAFADYALHPQKRAFYKANMSVENLTEKVLSGGKNLYIECEVWYHSMQMYRNTSFTVIKSTWSDDTVLMFMRDIEEQTNERKLLIEKSQKDNLTGLYNKHAFYDECKKYIESDIDDSYAIMFLDLDNFKSVNDTFGHIKGDEAIQTAAEKLQLIFSNFDIISRFGGDEFCILIKNVPHEILIDKLEWTVQKMREEYSDASHTVNISTSIGVALCSEGIEFGELLNRADKALYSAKERGKDRYVIYSDDLKLEGYIGRHE